MLTVRMDGLPMASKIYFPLESLLAETTSEGFISCVLAHVGNEVGGLTECLPTHNTLVRLLT